MRMRTPHARLQVGLFPTLCARLVGWQAPVDSSTLQCGRDLSNALLCQHTWSDKRCALHQHEQGLQTGMRSPRPSLQPEFMTMQCILLDCTQASFR